MQILVGTRQTQGQRSNDFSFVPEDEIVMMGSECDGEKVDGRCGCRRALVGTQKGSGATTTMKVIDSSITKEAYVDIIHNSLIAGGWGVDKGFSITMAEELLQIAAAFRVGDVVEKRGSRYNQRIVVKRQNNVVA